MLTRTQFRSDLTGRKSKESSPYCSFVGQGQQTCIYSSLYLACGCIDTLHVFSMGARQQWCDLSRWKTLHVKPCPLKRSSLFGLLFWNLDIFSVLGERVNSNFCGSLERHALKLNLRGKLGFNGFLMAKLREKSHLRYLHQFNCGCDIKLAQFVVCVSALIRFASPL